MTTGSKISVSRWYLDCVAPNGDFFMGAATSFRRSKLHINHLSGIFCRNDRIDYKSTVAFREVFPRQSGADLTWDCAPLSVCGRWTAVAPPIEQSLYAERNRQVLFHGLAPKAQVEVRIDNDYTLSGVGYADHLEVMADEWTLPIREVRWGRCLTERECFVWFDISGGRPQTWVWRNGVEQSIASVTDDLVALDNNITLGLAYRKPVREGTLGDTVLSSLPVLRYLLPGQFANCYERVWRTRGVLLRDIDQIDTGWAVHRLMRFSQ